MMKIKIFFSVILSTFAFSFLHCIAFSQEIDSETLQKWSAPYRDWHYYADPVIPSDYPIPHAEGFHNYDCPCVYQIPGKEDIWYMSFIGFNGKGYNSFVVESDDLVTWKNPRLAMGFGPEGQFDHGGCVIGAYLYESYDIKAARTLKKKDGKYWTLYGCYPKQGGYELRPGYESVASSEDGLQWSRAKDTWTLSVHDDDCGDWEKSCIYQPWLVEYEGKYYDFYNAAREGTEQTGLAFSNDLIHWKRYEKNPVIPVREGGYDSGFSADPKVFRDGDHWTMFYFGVGRGGASIMVAFSRDLLNWTADPKPLYKFGGHPNGLDKTFAHKISLVYHPGNKTFYMYYCAVGNRGRTIGLLTSQAIDGSLPRSAKPLYEVTASHTNAGESPDAACDGIEPKNSFDTQIPRMTFWPHIGVQEWVEIEFDEEKTVSESSVYWYDDTGTGSCRVPRSWLLSYRDGNSWKPVKTSDDYKTLADRYNTVRFSPVKTKALRLDVVLQKDYSGGILEWKNNGMEKK